MCEGYRKREINRVNELLYLAWHIAALERQKKLPSLKSLMQKVDEKAKPHKEQTVDEQIAMCRLLNAAFGGEFVEV